MAAITPTFLRGIVIPDERVSVSTYNTTDSTATQAGNKPGIPEPQQQSSMTLEGLGDMSAGKALRLRVTRLGMPGVDSARFVWYESGDTTTGYRYCDPPVLPTGWEFLDRSTVANTHRFPHVIRLASGCLLATEVYDTTKIRIWRRSTADAWTDIGIPTASITLDSGIVSYPCLLQLPSGRILCLRWYYGSQLAGLYSDDDGLTWTSMGSTLLQSAISLITYTSRGRLRAAYQDGRILLLAHACTATADKILQFASIDMGASFALVEAFAGDTTPNALGDYSAGTNVGYPEIVVHNGQFYCLYVDNLDNTTTPTARVVPRLKVLPTAFSPLSDAPQVSVQSDPDTMEWGTLSGGLYDSGDLAAWLDDDGALWLVGRDHDSSGAMELMPRYSVDSGETWEVPGSSPAAAGGSAILRTGDANTYARQISVAPIFGQAMLLHCFAANPGTADDSICAMKLGGYSTINGAARAESTTDRNLDRLGDTLHWLPIELPDDCGWTLTTTGAPTETMGTAGLQIQTAPLENARYSQAPSTSLSQGLTARAILTVGSGDNAGVELRISDATPLQYEVRVYVEDGRILFYDVNAAANIGSVTTTEAATGYVEVKLTLQSSGASCYYRALGSGNDRKWIEVGTDSTPTSSAANDGARIRWGNEGISDSTWRLVAYSFGAYVGEVNPASRTLGSGPTYVTFGGSIQAIDGPAMQDEVWHWDTAYSYPVRNLDPIVAPSPRQPWRSTADNAALELIWTLGTEDTRMRSRLLACGWVGGNIGTAELYGQASGGGWTKIADLDARLGSGLKYVREGAIIKPDLTGAASLDWYMPHGSAQGMTFKLDSTTGRKIRRSSSGAWTAGSATLSLTFELDDFSTSDPASGTAGELWASDYLCIVPVSTAYKAFKLKILAQHTADDYYQLGTFILGGFHPFGRPYSWGRGQEIRPLYELTEGRTGIRRGRSLGPSRRAVEIAWPDGIDMSQIGGSLSAPDYLVGYTGGVPVAVPAATAHDVFGILDELGGAVRCCAYLPRVALPGTSSTAVHIRHPEHLLWGRVMTETLRMDAVLGSEWANPGEVLRVGTVRMERET